MNTFLKQQIAFLQIIVINWFNIFVVHKSISFQNKIILSITLGNHLPFFLFSSRTKGHPFAHSDTTTKGDPIYYKRYILTPNGDKIHFFVCSKFFFLYFFYFCNDSFLQIILVISFFHSAHTNLPFIWIYSLLLIKSFSLFTGCDFPFRDIT